MESRKHFRGDERVSARILIQSIIVPGATTGQVNFTKLYKRDSISPGGSQWGYPWYQRKHPIHPNHPTEDLTLVQPCSRATCWRFASAHASRPLTLFSLHSLSCAGGWVLVWETLPALHPTVERPPLTSVVRFGVRFAHRPSAHIASLINLCWHPFTRPVASPAPRHRVYVGPAASVSPDTAASVRSHLYHEGDLPRPASRFEPIQTAAERGRPRR